MKNRVFTEKQGSCVKKSVFHDQHGQYVRKKKIYQCLNVNLKWQLDLLPVKCMLTQNLLVSTNSDKPSFSLINPVFSLINPVFHYKPCFSL